MLNLNIGVVYRQYYFVVGKYWEVTKWTMVIEPQKQFWISMYQPYINMFSAPTPTDSSHRFTQGTKIISQRLRRLKKSAPAPSTRMVNSMPHQILLFKGCQGCEPSRKKK